MQIALSLQARGGWCQMEEPQLCDDWQCSLIWVQLWLFFSTVKIKQSRVFTLGDKWETLLVGSPDRIHQPSLNNRYGGCSLLSPVWTNLLKQYHRQRPCPQGRGPPHLAVNNTVCDTPTTPEVSQSEWTRLQEQLKAFWWAIFLSMIKFKFTPWTYTG